ncbi:hypothetical protein GIB67_000985 [Kingdonia uniflora]|uniref:Transcription factor CBF/NF-Y/archaeal histone domain-containing protein n=1 Tax=Kingdonia uniflora TaxID=39325 RepID=A0A7J7MG10_9MAGN|nr:hypothetical protein GIB67_000985 [Kingdonia uniflora]
MGDSDADSGVHNSSCEFTSPREQDRFLPIANVSRIMKKGLPANAKISKDAKETVQECVSEFISFITGEASDKCQREKRKTINGDDLIWAMTTLGFEEYVEPLKIYLQKFREMEGEKAAMGVNIKEISSAGGGGGGGSSSGSGSGMYGGMQHGMTLISPHHQAQMYGSGFYHHGDSDIGVGSGKGKTGITGSGGASSGRLK